MMCAVGINSRLFVRVFRTGFILALLTTALFGQGQSAGKAAETLTPAERKIDSRVRRTADRMMAAGIDESNAASLNASQIFSDPLIRVDNEARIQLYLELSNVEAAERSILQSSGAEIELVNPDLLLVQAWVPFDRIELLAGFDFVLAIRAPDYASIRSGR